MDNVDLIGGYACPVDPMDALQCESCQQVFPFLGMVTVCSRVWDICIVFQIIYTYQNERT